MAIVGAVSAVASYMGQQQSAQQQADYQRAVAEQRNQEIKANYEAANAAAIDNYTQANQRQLENQENFSQTAQDIEVEKKNAIGELLASNLNTGLSLDAVKLDYERQSDKYLGVQELSLRNLGIQTEAEKKSAKAQAQNQANSISAYIPSPVNYPSPLSLAAGIGGAYVGSLDVAGSQTKFKNSSTGSRGGIINSTWSLGERGR